MGDETYKVFVNAAGTQGNVSGELKEFLEYLKNGSVKGVLTQTIDSEVKKAIRHDEWREEYMAYNIHDMDMKEEGRAEVRIETALSLMKLMPDLPIDQIAQITHLPAEQIIALKEK